MFRRALSYFGLFIFAAMACVPSNNTGLIFGPDTPADPLTTGYFINHVALNVNNLDKMMEFYIRVFGMRHIFTFNLTPHITFTYMSHSQGGRNGSAYQTTEEILRYKNNNAGHMELVHLNVDKEDLPGSSLKASTMHHIGIIVPDLEATQSRLELYNVTIYKKINEPMPSTGPLSDKFSLGDATNLSDEEFALLQAVMSEFNRETIFASDPDGNLLEILPLNEPNLFG
jgi:lactoylglutathione lyase